MGTHYVCFVGEVFSDTHSGAMYFKLKKFIMS